tara:strand:- start:326 stop:1288 length:963 start_codon:yes stop_codon:yes gene_type:complete
MSEYASDTEADVAPMKKNDPIHPPVDWTEAHENILVEWADKALCYRWLHSKAHAQYSSANAWFTIPVIVMSTITGTANFAQDKFSENIKPYATMGIGAVNIFAGILTTIQQFLKIGELNEAHRVAGIAWDKFYRNIKVELAKAPSERIPVIQMLKISKEEFDRLMETSPAISEKITELFKTTFIENTELDDADINSLSSKQKAFMELKKPEICDELVSCKSYIYKLSDSEKAKKSMKNNISLARKVVKQKAQVSRIEHVIALFIETRKREPTEEEILNELDGENITIDMISEVLNDRNDNDSKLNENIKLTKNVKGDDNV